MKHSEKWTPEHLRDEESRRISDAKLIHKGAEFVLDENATQPRLEVTKKLIENVKDTPNSREEALRNFIEFIKIGHSYPIEEAIDIMATFHRTTKERILRAFTGLGLPEYQGGTVVFRESINGGHPCLGMTIRDKDGHLASNWDHLLDRYTGQPQNHTG